MSNARKPRSAVMVLVALAALVATYWLGRTDGWEGRSFSFAQPATAEEPTVSLFF